MIFMNKTIETIDLIITEKQVEDIAERILAKTRDKIKDQIGDGFYNELRNYCYEHYTNHKDRVEAELIDEITEKFVKEPDLYKFGNLRKKIWYENKDEIVKTLTDEAIKDSVENVIQDYTHRDYHFNWQWKDGIVEIILKNWDKFKDDERIKEAFGRELNKQQSLIDSLKHQLQEIKNITD